MASLSTRGGLSAAASAPFSSRPSVARAVGVLRFVPSLVTLLGLLLGVVGLLLGPSLAGLLALGAGLGCDVLDGQMARRLGLVTRFGACFDLTADTLLAGATFATLAARGHPAWLVGVVLCAILGARTQAHPFPFPFRKRRGAISGRAFATVAAMVAYAGALE